jgi:hypothetical protein
MEEQYKKCSICKHTLALNEFNKHKDRSDGLQSHCRDCNKKRSKKYYSDNKEKHYKIISERKSKVTQQNRQFVYNYVIENGCVDCGENTPECCDFDHVHGDKKANLSHMIHHGYSLSSILKEMSKCVIRCSNCHRKRTAKQFNWYANLKDTSNEV